MSRVIEVIDYQSTWPELFADECKLFKTHLGDTVVKVHHIGSTAVVGLAAKPVIDIILEVTSLVDLDYQQTLMTKLGYTAKGENGIVGRRFFIKGGDARSHHVHAFEYGDAHVKRHLAFRDYLRRNPEIAHQYGQIKKQAAAQCSRDEGDHDAALYCQLKDEFVAYHEKLALEACHRPQ